MRRVLALIVVVALAVAVWLGVQFVREGGGVDGVYNRAVFPLDYDAAIRAAAKKQRLDPALVSAMIYVESGFDPEARSSKGAVGLMQVLPATAAQIARETGGTSFEATDLEDPKINVRYGTYYLRRSLDQFEQNTVAAVAAYNAGSVPVSEWVASAHAEGRALHPSDIPYAETRAYVTEVLRVRGVYRETYGERLAPSPSPSPDGT